MTAKMAQQVRVLAAEPDDLNSRPGLSVMEGENQLPQLVLWSLHTVHVLCVHMRLCA